MISFEIFLAIGMFTAIVLGLVVIILAARAKLVSSGDVNIVINGERTLTVPAGGKLLQRITLPPVSPQLTKIKLRSPIEHFAKRPRESVDGKAYPVPCPWRP